MLRENSGHAAPPAGGHDGQRTEPLTHFSRNNLMARKKRARFRFQFLGAKAGPFDRERWA